jgi:hypothetical protein
MIECVRRKSGSRLPWMVVKHLQNCTWRTSPLMRAKRTWRWHISKSISRGVCNGDVTFVWGVGKRVARTRRCSRAAAAVSRGFAAQIIRRWLRKKPHWAGIWPWGGTRISAGYSASGARLSKTVWRLTRALRTWWLFCSDDCAMPRRREEAPAGGCDCLPCVSNLAEE